MILTLFMLTSCKKDIEKTPETPLVMGDFTISTNELSPGKTIDFAYNGNSNDVESIYYYIINTKAYPMDINLSSDKTASITIPDSAQAIAFNLKVDGKYDHNDKKGYLFPLKNAEGNTIAGSQSALANYVMNYGSDFGITVDKTQLLVDIMQDIDNNPEITDEWNTKMLSLIYEQHKEKGESKINDYINTIKAKEKLTEKDYSTLISLYSTLGNNELAKATTNEAFNNFPKGEISKKYLYNLFYDTKSVEEKTNLFEKYRKTFNELGPIGNQMAGSLARGALNDGNDDKFKYYSELIDDNISKAGMFNSMAWSRAEKGEDLEFASEISKQSLNLVKEAEQNLKDKPNYLTQNQFKESLKYSYNMYADTYAFILYKQGNLKDAITYQKQAVGEGKNGEINERYVEFLVKDEQFKTVIDASESFIKKGHATRKIKEYYKQAFIKNNGDAGAFDAKLAALENDAFNNLKAKIESKILDEEAPEFTLKNTKNEEVSLASLKGKTVILDFWATWCGPCKASFPGMQEVVTKYKDDDNVVLLFVDTFEGGGNREQLVTDFIAKNNYDFHVVYDNEIENSRDFEVASKYGVSGIPTKVIIDKNGKIRFKSVGYSGQTEKLVKELDIMIDILKS